MGEWRWDLMDFKQIIDIIVNNGTSLALLVYFVYKDNKFTENLTKALTSIDESLELLKNELIKK